MCTKKAYTEILAERRVGDPLPGEESGFTAASSLPFDRWYWERRKSLPKAERYLYKTEDLLGRQEWGKADLCYLVHREGEDTVRIDRALVFLEVLVTDDGEHTYRAVVEVPVVEYPGKNEEADEDFFVRQIARVCSCLFLQTREDAVLLIEELIEPHVDGVVTAYKPAQIERPIHVNIGHLLQQEMMLWLASWKKQQKNKLDGYVVEAPSTEYKAR